MVSSKADTPREYLASLPEERRDAIAVVRSVILDNLPAGFEEGMQFGMLSYQVPLAVYPDTYNQQAASIACLASQKGYMSLYLMGVYADPTRRRRFEQAFKKAGKKLDMGKACIRFRRLEDVPLDVLGEAFRRIPARRYVGIYTQLLASRGGAPAKPKTTAKKVAPKKPAAKKPAARAAAKAVRAPGRKKARSAAR